MKRYFPREFNTISYYDKLKEDGKARPMHAQKENAQRALAVRSAYAYDHSLGSRRRSLRRDCGLRYPRWRGRGASSVLCVTLYV